MGTSQWFAGVHLPEGICRILEAHSGLSGLVVENARVQVNGQVIEYDGIWESSLTDSATKDCPTPPSSVTTPGPTPSTRYSMLQLSLLS